MAFRPYVVLTASDAARFNEVHPASTPPILSLNRLLDAKAASHPDAIVACFPRLSSPSSGAARDWSWDLWSFARLRDEAALLASFFASPEGGALPVRRAGCKGRMVVGLLSPSCDDFLLALFACLRLGLGVLLIAPQNTPEGVAKLCEMTGATHLLAHSTFRDLAEASVAASASQATFQLVQLPVQNAWIEGDAGSDVKSELEEEDEPDTLSVIFHSSGSSGFPKPIYQTHRLWTEPLPHHPGPPAYTTTPLFHGGASDLFRSMNASSTLLLFPSTLPVTSANVLSSLVSVPTSLCPPAFFLSVPYILELLADSPDGLARLQRFDLVSTGGSPMPKELGDRLVQDKVRLVSRYGSSECGFLMSSDRDYETDVEWSYLRSDPAALELLHFEPHGEGQWALVVDQAWRSKCVANREDGSFATGDVFMKHPSIEGAWLLSGRSDDVILMSNGEKTSPAPLEDVLRQSPLVTDALVFGSNRSSIGALIVPASSFASPSVEALRSTLAAVNAIAPRHSQLSPELVVFLPPSAVVPRASKGSLQRGRAYDVFAAEIEQAYLRFDGTAPEGSGSKLTLEGEDLVRFIEGVVGEAVGEMAKGVGRDDDLFALGVNSLQAVRIRNALQKRLDLKGAKLPSNVVFESSTMIGLAQYIARLGSTSPPSDAPSIDELELQLMRDLEATLGPFPASTGSRGEDSASENIVLTGTTGALGAHLLHQLLASSPSSKITLLCRAKDDTSALARVEASLRERRLPAPDQARVRCFASDFASDRLGLQKETYDELARSTTLVIHAAWQVNFVGRLAGFKPQLKGLRNLILAITQPCSLPSSRLFFCSSTACILSRPLDSPLLEDISDSSPEKDAVPMGYARSKAVAEAICRSAAGSCLPGGRVGVLRLGQLCSDTVKGVWNEGEGWPLMIASAQLAGCLPDLYQPLSWLPVDLAARAIVEITSPSRVKDDAPLVYHLANESPSPSFWSDLLSWLREAGLAFDVVPAVDWLARLRAAGEKDRDGQRHASLGLLDLWEASYGVGTERARVHPSFDVSNASRVSETMASLGPISKDLVLRTVAVWKEKGFLRV